MNNLTPPPPGGDRDIWLRWDPDLQDWVEIEESHRLPLFLGLFFRGVYAALVTVIGFTLFFLALAFPWLNSLFISEERGEDDEA